MYVIKVDDEVLYSPNLSSEGYSVLNPKLKMELNKAGSLEFLVPPSHVKYDDIRKLKSIIQVFDGSEEIFRGRVLHDEKDFYKEKQVYCEGELAFLLDSIQRIYDHQGTLDDLFKKYITDHNSQVEESKQFVVGQITVEDKNNYVHYSSTQYPNTWNELNEKLISTHGGYVRTRLQDGVRYIDYIADYENVSSQIIEFGVNMLDISEYISADDVFTVLIPLGADQKDSDGNSTGRLTISSVNDGEDYIQDDDAIALFGKIWKIHEWDDVTLPSNLLEKGKDFLKDGIQMAVTLTIKAVDLHLLNVDTERIRLGDYVRVLSVPHNLDRLFQCSCINLDLVNPESSEYTFGVNFQTISDSQTSTSKAAASMNTTVGNVQQTVSSLNASVENVIGKMPTKLSELENDSDFVISDNIPKNLSDLTNDSDFVDAQTFQKLADSVSALEEKEYVDAQTFQELADRVSALENEGKDGE